MATVKRTGDREPISPGSGRSDTPVVLRQVLDLLAGVGSAGREVRSLVRRRRVAVRVLDGRAFLVSVEERSQVQTVVRELQ